MSVVILDPIEAQDYLQRREASDGSRYDEVWDGVTIVAPLPDNEHQELVTKLSCVFFITVNDPGLGKVRAGTNVSDREAGWLHNYREPEVAVFLQGTAARNCDTHWVGGPDFAVEIISPHDWTRRKLPFYAQIGTRELLLVDRDPWALELYRLEGGTLVLAGKSDLSEPNMLTSSVLPLTFRLVPGEVRPCIEVVHADGVQRWLV
jgi:Uma2 family endonuclease